MVFLILAALLALGYSTAWANGRATLIASQEQGPYRVDVSILPSRAVVNNTHLSVRIVELASEATLTEAKVSVSATGPAPANGIGPLPADNNVLPQFFEATLPFDAPGPWQLSISVDSALGQETIQVPLEVRERQPINLILVAAIAVAALALVIWTFDRIRGTHRRRREAT